MFSKRHNLLLHVGKEDEHKLPPTIKEVFTSDSATRLSSRYNERHYSLPQVGQEDQHASAPTIKENKRT